MKMTKRKRFQVYRALLRYYKYALENEIMDTAFNEYRSFCIALHLISDDLSDYYVPGASDSIKDYPELMAYKPLRFSIKRYWFTVAEKRGVEKRIKVLQEILNK